MARLDSLQYNVKISWSHEDVIYTTVIDCNSEG